MTATKEQIIETALQILQRYEPLNMDSIRLDREKVFIPSINNDYYLHDGWSFNIKGIELHNRIDGYEQFPDVYSLDFLEDGICIYFALDPGEGGSGIRSYMIYDEEMGIYKGTGNIPNKFLAHHNFDFNDPKFEKYVRDI